MHIVRLQLCFYRYIMLLLNINVCSNRKAFLTTAKPAQDHLYIKTTHVQRPLSDSPYIFTM